MTHTIILRNGGGGILRNGGGNVLRNGQVSGVDIHGNHSKQVYDVRGGFDPRRKREITHIFEATAKITKTTTLAAQSRILHTIESTAQGRITRLLETTTTAKITRIHNISAESLVFSRDEEKTDQYYKLKDINQHINENKKQKLKRLFDIFKDI